MADSIAQHKGRLVADALAGAWREVVPPFLVRNATDRERVAGVGVNGHEYALADGLINDRVNGHEDTLADGRVSDVAVLELVAPMLHGSGAGALVWWKLKDSELAGSEVAEGFRQAYLQQTLMAAVAEGNVGRAFELLGDAGVDALLVKGLAAARAYPEAGLRPFGDIDICVRPGELARAARALATAEGARLWVDLKEGWEESDARDFDELLARSEVLSFGDGGDARVPSAEDHLRLVCLHMLRHGAWRPLWMCDVAAALEGRPKNFDWSRMLEGDGRRARWVACAVGLAERLLGAETKDTPFERAAEELPRWLAPEVLKGWATPFAAMQAPMRYRAPMRKYLRRPGGVWSDLLRRWPNPIEATVRVGGPLNELPRWPFQLANCLKRTTRFLTSANKAATRVRRAAGA